MKVAFCFGMVSLLSVSTISFAGGLKNRIALYHEYRESSSLPRTATSEKRASQLGIESPQLEQSALQQAPQRTPEEERKHKEERFRIVVENGMKMQAMFEDLFEYEQLVRTEMEAAYEMKGKEAILKFSEAKRTYGDFRKIMKKIVSMQEDLLDKAPDQFSEREVETMGLFAIEQAKKPSKIAVRVKELTRMIEDLTKARNAENKRNHKPMEMPSKDEAFLISGYLHDKLTKKYPLLKEFELSDLDPQEKPMDKVSPKSSELEECEFLETDPVASKQVSDLMQGTKNAFAFGWKDPR